jgi:hypothetical protein
LALHLPRTLTSFYRKTEAFDACLDRPSTAVTENGSTNHATKNHWHLSVLGDGFLRDSRPRCTFTSSIKRAILLQDAERP